MQQRQQRAAERALHDQTNLLPRGKLLTVLAALSGIMLISFIDQNGIGVTLPTIAVELDAHDTISWAGTSSLVANTVFQMLYGRMSDIFGRKVVLLAATGLLSLAALLCGLAHDSAAFYVYRGLAGIGGGGISNLAMIIVSDIVTLEERGKYQGVIGSMIGLGNVAGPFLAAAFITGTGSWRGFFFMVSPLAALVGAVSYFLLPSKPPVTGVKENLKKIDAGGVFLSSVAVIFLLIPISGGGAYFPWDSPMVISMLVIGAVALVLFVLVEWKVAKLPMMPISIFHNSCVATLLIQTFLLGSVFQTSLYYLPMYLQNARGFTVLKSACFASISVGIQAVASILSGQYISRCNRYIEVIWTGFGLWTLGCCLTLLYNRTTSEGVLALPLILNGIGVGFILQPTLVALQAHVSRDRRAVIISNRNFFRCAGGAVGLAVSASVLQAVLRAQLPAGWGWLADNSYAVPARDKLLRLAKGDERVVNKVLDAYMAASRGVFIVQIPIMMVCLLGCFLVKDRGLEPPDVQEEESRGSDEDVEVNAGLEEAVPASSEKGDSVGPDSPSTSTSSSRSGSTSGQSGTKAVPRPGGEAGVEGGLGCSHARGGEICR